MDNIRIYDNGGRSYDRFTAVDMNAPEHQPGCYAAIGFNATPFHPLGFGQHVMAIPGRHLGKRVQIKDLPPDAAKFVRQFANE